jgi:hypothetical protein
VASTATLTMARRTRTLLILFAAVALLGVVAYAQLERERVREPLTRLDTAAVRSVAVSCNGCTARRFEKVDGHWQMREPFVLPADDAAVDTLVAIALAPVRFRHAAATLDAGKLGLDPPQATLRLDATVITFGTTDAIHGDRYVKVGDTIALVPDRFSMQLFAAPENELAAAVAAGD